MSNFDISTFRTFNPPKFRCKKCCALLRSMRFSGIDKVFCPVCNVAYVGKQTLYDYRKYLKGHDLFIQTDGMIEHCQKLAGIVAFFNDNSADYPPMKALLDAINAARSFIHFTTYGLSWIIYDALKLKAQTTPICGIASNISTNFLEELNNYPLERGKMQLQVYGQRKQGEEWDAVPHQKLLVQLGRNRPIVMP